MSNAAQTDRALDALCRIHGIAAEYTDIWGRTQRAADTTRVALLEALGVFDEHENLDAALREAETHAWREALPPVAVFPVEELPYRVRLRFEEQHARATFHWTLTLEHGQTHSGTFKPCELETLTQHELDGVRYIEVAFDWRNTLPLGYHRFSLSGPGLAGATTAFVVAPEHCYLPPALESGARVWGAALQLYALRSERNWGMGDFTDLRMVIEQWGKRGAGVIGVNPLHALFPHNPAHSSPYSPSSRLFLNALYIDVEAIPDARECAEALATMGSAQFQSARQAARGAELVDYNAVAALKLPLLERLHRHFREHHLAPETERGRAFRRFQTDGGQRLRQHTLFEALQEHFHREDSSVWGWPAWPQAYRHPEAPEVAQFAQSHGERIEFYQYLQWQATVQLEQAGAAADALGYSVGLYRDLAISVDRGGAESWANQAIYAVGTSVGAPPDEVNLNGQNWGLPPIRPGRLRAEGYDSFIATLRANMRCAGALRIDHVMGLARLYWIPPGASAAAGAYVHYPFEDLLSILALESDRNRCMVIGEDLGTVPQEMRARLARARVLSYRLFYFERHTAGDFKAPAEYPVDALVAASTHDLATLASFWEGHDLELRRALGLFPSDEVRAHYVVSRAQERARLTLALEREQLLPDGVPMAAQMTPELTRAIHEYLARTPSRVLVVQLEDLLGLTEQANVPGTTSEHPNWQRKLPLTLEQIERDERFQALTETLARVRPAQHEARKHSVASARPRIPRCTYRLQLNREFTFADATALIPYLDRLGVSHVYCSPYLRARSGSMHGYDTVDHNTLNPEIGSMEDFERFVAALRAHGMGHILDMVPNHMGVMGADNAWWLDVLESGPASAYAEFFDIDWQPANAALTNKVLIPVLGDQYGLVLERGELKLSFKPERGEFSVSYYDHRFPIDPREYPRILESASSRLTAPAIPADAFADLASLSSAFGHLPGREETSSERRVERSRDKDVHKRRLARLVGEHSAIGSAIEETVQEFNAAPQDRSSFEPLHELLERQAYRLSSWRVATDEINYRRFFDINDLAALRMENDEAFEATHRFVLGLAAEGKIDGLRIDHPDGLYDPEQYFRRLQQRYAQLAGVESGVNEDGRPARPLYVVIEKIAASHEKLPESWAVYGTSGYRYATFVNGVLVDHEAADEMERIYRDFAPDALDYAESAYQGKQEVMRAALASPHTMLATSTHDNKRSEDVRARIDVLSEMPAEWRKLARRWERMNRRRKVSVEECPAPSSNDEYLLYQTLLGTFPAGDADERALETYCERIVAYMLKAVREAKVHTSWINTNEAYEAAISAFVRALLAPSGRNLFLKDLRIRAAPIAWCGALNSLSMTLLKMTSPGVPDIYQGNETCDLSLVDPDSRRPVDYAARSRMLDQLASLGALTGYADDVRSLAASALDGRAKMWIVWRLLELRRLHPDVFELGQYVPLQVHGARAGHVIAFVRRHQGASVVTVAGRLWMKLGAAAGLLPLGDAIWGDTTIDAGALSGRLVNVLTGDTLSVSAGRIKVADALCHFPGAVLRPAADQT